MSVARNPPLEEEPSSTTSYESDPLTNQRVKDYALLHRISEREALDRLVRIGFQKMMSSKKWRDKGADNETFDEFVARMLADAKARTR